MKQGLIILALVFFIRCNTEMKKKQAEELKKSDTATTKLYMAILGINVKGNDYRAATIKEIIKDTVKMVKVDSTTQKMMPAKDTSYFAWWPNKVFDSTGKTYLQSRAGLGGDSTVLMWTPMEKEFIVIKAPLDPKLVR